MLFEVCEVKKLMRVQAWEEEKWWRGNDDEGSAIQVEEEENDSDLSLLIDIYIILISYWQTDKCINY